MSFDYKTGSEATLHKFHVTLFTCASSRGIILDAIPRLDASSFIRSFKKRFISRCRCPTNMNSDGTKKPRNLSVDLEFKTSLWQDAFFARLVRICKVLLRKELGNLQLNYEQLQIVLLEIVTMFNNWPLTYYYYDEDEPYLTPNHMYDIWKSIKIMWSRNKLWYVKNTATWQNLQHIEPFLESLEY